MVKIKYQNFLILIFSFIVSDVVCARNQALAVSLIIPCHWKHVIYLQELLKCYESQTVLPDEVIISISEMERVPSSLIDNLVETEWKFPVKFIFSNGVVYAGENRNKACHIATGDIFICQDADDLPSPNRIEVIRYFFDTYKVDHLMHLYNFTCDLKKTDMKEINFVYPKNYRDIWDGISKFHNGNIAIKRHVFDNIKWSSRPKGQDVEFNEKVYKKFKCIVIFVPLAIYRIEYSSWVKNLVNMLKNLKNSY